MYRSPAAFKVLNAPNKLHFGTAMRAFRSIGLVSVERVESKRVDDFASMSDEETQAICLFDNFAALRPPPIEWPGNCGYTRRMVNRDTSTFIFLTACLFGGVLIAAFAFHLYLTGG